MEGLTVREEFLALVASANADMPARRRVTPGAALTILDRAFARTTRLPQQLREFLAQRDLSDFILMSQRGISMQPRPFNTDLLPVGNPLSTQPHSMNQTALRASAAYWIASDPRITSDTHRALLASALQTQPGTAAYEYYQARLTALPHGAIPVEALIASFGDGNSSAARAARARMQRRDRKGRFAWMGGGMSVFVRRIGGGIHSLSGRVVGQGVGNDDTFDVELPDGRIARVPAKASEGRKAYLPDPNSPDGFSPAVANVDASDPVINEEDLQFVDAPNGFRKDELHDGPGQVYTDDAYAVTVNTDTNGKRSFQVARIDNNRAGKPFATGESWADVQDAIRKDEPNRDKQEGRTPDPVAVLPDDEYNRLMESGADRPKTPADAPYVSPSDTERRILDRITPPSEVPGKRGGVRLDPELEDFLKKSQTERDSKTPSPDDVTIPPTDVAPNKSVYEPDAADQEMVFEIPDGAYEPDRGEYVPKGRRNQEADDYTDDPVALAQDHNLEDLQSALAEAVSPNKNGDAPEEGYLDFNGGEEAVPAEALFHAVGEAGGDPYMVLAQAYDKALGNSNNEDRLNELRGNGQTPEAVLPGADENIPDRSRAEQIAELRDVLPAAMQGATDEEIANYLDTGDYANWLKPNQDADAPEGYYVMDPDPSRQLDAQERADAGLPDEYYDSPVDLAINIPQQDLEDQLRAAIEPSSHIGYGQFYFDDGSDTGYLANVPAENLRDALQLQGVDTDALVEKINSEGRRSDVSETEAGRILADLEAQPDTGGADTREGIAARDAALALGFPQSFADALENGDFEAINNQFLDVQDILGEAIQKHFGPAKTGELTDPEGRANLLAVQRRMDALWVERYGSADPTPEQVDSVVQDVVADVPGTNVEQAKAIIQDEVKQTERVQHPNGDSFDVKMSGGDGAYGVSVTDKRGKPRGLGVYSTLDEANAVYEKAKADIADGKFRMDGLEPWNDRSHVSVPGPDGTPVDISVNQAGGGKSVVSVAAPDGSQRVVGAYDTPGAASERLNDVAQAVAEDRFDVSQVPDVPEADMAVMTNRKRSRLEAQIDRATGMAEDKPYVNDIDGGKVEGKAANGNNHREPWYDFLRKFRFGRKNMYKGRGPALAKAREQLAKYIDGWDDRGIVRPRPRHHILPREDVVLGDNDYKDVNGNIIRIGDEVAHVRAGELISTDYEPVNKIRARVLDRVPYTRDGVQRPGGLWLEVLEADDSKWVGRQFFYVADRVEIIEQPDLKDQAQRLRKDLEANDPDLFRQRIMWEMPDSSLYGLWALNHVDMQQAPENKDVILAQRAVEREMAARHLLNPLDMAEFLDLLDDNALDNIEPDLGVGRGFQGYVLDQLVANERERRNVGKAGRNNLSIPALTMLDYDRGLYSRNNLPELNKRMQKRPIGRTGEDQGVPNRPAPPRAEREPAVAPNPRTKREPQNTPAPAAEPPLAQWEKELLAGPSVENVPQNREYLSPDQARNQFQEVADGWYKALRRDRKNIDALEQGRQVQRFGDNIDEAVAGMEGASLQQKFTRMDFVDAAISDIRAIREDIARDFERVAEDLRRTLNREMNQDIANSYVESYREANNDDTLDIAERDLILADLITHVETLERNGQYPDLVSEIRNTIDVLRKEGDAADARRAEEERKRLAQQPEGRTDAINAIADRGEEIAAQMRADGNRAGARDFVQELDDLLELLNTAEDRHADGTDQKVVDNLLEEAMQGAQELGKFDPEFGDLVAQHIQRNQARILADRSPEPSTPSIPEPPALPEAKPIDRREVRNRVAAMLADVQGLQIDGAPRNQSERVVRHLKARLEAVLDTAARRRSDHLLNQDLDTAILAATKLGLYGRAQALMAMRRRVDVIPHRPTSPEFQAALADLTDAHDPAASALHKVANDNGVYLANEALLKFQTNYGNLVLNPDPYDPKFRSAYAGALNALNALSDKAIWDTKAVSPSEYRAAIESLMDKINALGPLPDLPSPKGAGNLRDVGNGQQGPAWDKLREQAASMSGISWSNLMKGVGPWTVKWNGGGINGIGFATNSDTGEVVVLKRDDVTNGANSEEMVATLYKALGFAAPGALLVNPDATDKDLRNHLVMEAVQPGFNDFVDIASAAKHGMTFSKIIGSVYGGDGGRLDLIDENHRAEVLQFVLANGIIGNSDRHHGNFMMGQVDGGGWRVIPIDNGLSLFHSSFGLAERNSDNATYVNPIDVVFGSYGNINGMLPLAKAYVSGLSDEQAVSEIVEFAQRMQARAEQIHLVDARAREFIRERAQYMIEHADEFVRRVRKGR